MMMAIWISNQFTSLPLFSLLWFHCLFPSFVWKSPLTFPSIFSTTMTTTKIFSKSSSTRWNSLSLTLSEFFELGETWSTKRQNKKKNILNKIYMVSLGSEKKQWARDALSERKGKKKYFSIFVVWTIWRQPISFSCSTMVSGSFSQRNYWTLNLQSRFYQISSPFCNPLPSSLHRQAFAHDFSSLHWCFLSIFSLAVVVAFDNENRIFSVVMWRPRVDGGKKKREWERKKTFTSFEFRLFVLFYVDHHRRRHAFHPIAHNEFASSIFRFSDFSPILHFSPGVSASWWRALVCGHYR